MKEVRICRKFLCLLWNLQYWSIEHEVSRSKIKRLWNFFDSFLMSLQFCSVFFWFMLPKVWKYDRYFHSTIVYSIIKKLNLLQQRPAAGTIFKCLRTFLILLICNIRLTSRARKKSIVFWRCHGLVLQRVVNFRFRAGSGYCNPGSGPGTGIPLNLKPGYRVPSG